MGQVSVTKYWKCLLASVVRSAQNVTCWHICPPQCPFHAGSFCTSTPWQVRGLADGQQVSGLYWRLVAVLCKSEGCVTSVHLSSDLWYFYDAAGILAGYESCMNPVSAKVVWGGNRTLFPSTSLHCVPGSTACQCILWSNCWLHWACWTEFQLDFVLLFPLIHLKYNHQICFCKLPEAFFAWAGGIKVLTPSQRPLCVWWWEKANELPVQVSDPTDDLLSPRGEKLHLVKHLPFERCCLEKPICYS